MVHKTDCRIDRQSQKYGYRRITLLHVTCCGKVAHERYNHFKLWVGDLVELLVFLAKESPETWGFVRSSTVPEQHESVTSYEVTFSKNSSSVCSSLFETAAEEDVLSAQANKHISLLNLLEQAIEGEDASNF